MLQEWSQERYMKEFRSLGTRQTPIAEDASDPELLTLAVQLSPYAYRLVREQYKFACSADAQYAVKIDGARVELHMAGDDEDESAVHVVNTTVRVICTEVWIRYHLGYPVSTSWYIWFVRFHLVSNF
jgi:hypothetical protein